MINTKKILLLGGEGFIGRNIAKYLLPKYLCFSLGIEKSIFPERNDTFIKSNPYEDLVPGEYDVVVHLIDNVISEDKFKKQELKLLKNIKFSKGGHCILFSSSVVYANPNSDYAKRKVILEETYKEYCSINNINITIFRLFNIFGEYQLPYKPGSLVSNLLNNYLSNKITEINDMNAKRDFIYAADMVKFINLVIEKEYFGLTDIATEKLITIETLINIIEKDVLRNKLLLRDYNNNENIICPMADNKLINKVKLMSLEKGLKETLDFYKKNNAIINLKNKKNE